MKQALHIFRKDLRRMWPWLGLLALVILLRLVTVFFPLETPAILDRGPAGQWLLPLTYGLIVARLIQEEPLVGTTAFWLARPINRWSLLGAKALFMTIFLVAAPVLVQFGTLLALQVEPARIPAMLAWGVLSQIEILIPLAVLAAVTPNLSAFALAFVAVFVALGMWSRFLPVLHLSGYWTEAAATRALIRGLLILAAGGGLLVYQYRSRRTTVTLAVAAAALLAVPLADSAVDSNFLFRGEEEEAPGIAGSEVTIALDSELPPLEWTADGEALGFTMAKSVRGASGSTVLVGLLKLPEAPPGYYFTTRNIQSEIVYEDGVRVRSAGLSWGRISGGRFPAEFTEFENNEREEKHGPEMHTLCLVPDGDLRRYGNRKGTLRLECEIAAVKMNTVVTLPLEIGREFRRRSLTASINQVEADNRSVWLRVGGLYVNERYRPSIDPQFLVVNRSRRQMFHAMAGTRQTRQDLVVGGASLTRWVLLNVFPRELNDRLGLKFAMDDEWVRNAELVICEERVDGVYRQSLRIEDFRMVDYTIENWMERQHAGMTGR